MPMLSRNARNSWNSSSGLSRSATVVTGAMSPRGTTHRRGPSCPMCPSASTTARPVVGVRPDVLDADDAHARVDLLRRHASRSANASPKYRMYERMPSAAEPAQRAGVELGPDAREVRLELAHAAAAPQPRDVGRGVAQRRGSTGPGSLPATRHATV